MPLPCSIQRLLQNLVWTLLLIGLITSCDRKRNETTTLNEQTDISSIVFKAHFLISSTGDTVPTGVPIPAKGKWINPGSVAKPKTIPLRGTPKVVPAHPNVHPAGTPKVVPIPKNLTVITPGKDGVPLPKTEPAKGIVVPAIQPQPVPAF